MICCSNIQLSDCCNGSGNNNIIPYYGEVPDNILLAAVNRSLPDPDCWPHEEIRVVLLNRPDATFMENAPVVLRPQPEAVFYKADTWSGKKIWAPRGIMK